MLHGGMEHVGDLRFGVDGTGTISLGFSNTT